MADKTKHEKRLIQLLSRAFINSVWGTKGYSLSEKLPYGASRLLHFRIAQLHKLLCIEDGFAL